MQTAMGSREIDGKMRFAGKVLLVLMAITPGSLEAADSPDAVVRERQSDMKTMSEAAKSISEFFSGRRTYDATAFRAKARSIADLGGQTLIGHFSTVVTAAGSQAREEIGTERGKFDKLAHALAAYAAQVAASAQDGEPMPNAMRMRPGEMAEGSPFARKREGDPDLSAYSAEHAFHMMLQTCTTCHAAFRVKR